MIRSNSSLLARVAVGGCLILLLCLAAPAYCQDESAALMLQVSPVDGGSVNLSPGVHNYDRDSQVLLTATPKTGYQFVCWLGNVADARASSTSVFLDTPKIIIAVFERSKFAFLEYEEDPDVSAGGGGLIRSRTEAGSDATGEGGRRPQKYHYPNTPNEPIPEVPPPNVPETLPPDVPVPETPLPDVPVPQDNEEPPPVPEPATVAFLLLGMLFMVKRPRRSDKVQHQNAII
jgi:hypothetical protein